MKKYALGKILSILCLTSWVTAFSGSQWQSVEVVIYKQPQAHLYGIANDTSSLAIRDIYDFGQGIATSVQALEGEGFLTAVQVQPNRSAALDALFQEVPSAEASRHALKDDGFYSSIEINEHQLHRITQYYQYNEFDHQVATKLEHPHYLYHNRETGVAIEFALERAPIDLLIAISKLEIAQDVHQELIKSYQQAHVIRIYRVNHVNEQEHPSLEDVMFAATLLGDKEQPLSGVASGNDYLGSIIDSLKHAPAMNIYLNL